MAEQKKRKKRMTLPKKKEDIEKVVEEVSERHGHEHEHHHHHHHGDIDELLTVIELLLDSTNATVKVLDSKVKHQANEIATLYRVLAKVVEACLAAENREERRAKLLEALEALGVAPSKEAKAF
ncbi:MAG: hypothetical protein GSR73_03990 [Desulfurococcales archaeon]|nr:hypothetical protein [Desulfurococcales archaeon]